MIAYFVRHPTVANLLMIAFLAIGLSVAPSLQRATFPKIEADKVSIQVLYPGARPEMVEEAICQRLEDAIDGVDVVSETLCEARQGVATATVEMREGGDLDRFFSDIDVAVDGIDDFPDLVETPILSQVGRTDFVASLAISGPSRGPDLQAYAEEIKDRLQAFGGLPKLEVKGFSDRQLRIEIERDTLRAYGLSLADVARIVGQQNVELPAGEISSSDGEILLRFADERRSVDALKDLVIGATDAGGRIRLGDVARIEDRFENDEVRIELDGRPAALIDIVKSEDDDTLTVVDRLEAFLELERQRAPPGVRLEIVKDAASIVRDRLTLLLENGLIGLLLVCAATWAFFGLRYAFWISMGLPVAFMGGIAAMAVLGYSLNMLTMVGLLIVVGILMDDAIVISENIASKREAGAGPLDAAVAGAQEVAPGVLSSFATTLCIFGSLAFIEGDLGQVLRVVPVVMLAVLALSLVEAFLILPHHLGHALAGRGDNDLGPVQRAADRALTRLRDDVVGPLAARAVRHRMATLGVAVAMMLLATASIAGGLLKFSAFPELDGDTIEARVLLPAGAPLERTEAVVADVLAAIDRIDARLTPEQPDGAPLVESRLVRFNENQDAYESGPHVATVSVDLLTSERRTIDNAALEALWREEIGAPTDVVSLKIAEPSVGPAGRAIDIRLVGDDLDALKAASLDLQTWLNGYAGVVDLLDDLRLGMPEATIRIREEGEALGLRAEDVAAQIRAGFFGDTVDEIQVGGQSFEVDVRLAQGDRADLSALDEFLVTTPSGALAPLSAVAILEADRGVARINRVDGRRAVTIQGEVDTRIANANAIISDTLQRFAPELLARHPGVEIALEGQNAKAAETQQSMLAGFALGLVGVFLVLSLQLRSYVEPVVVMALIPFAFVGAVTGHLLLGIDFTMPSLLGFAALSGVVVNDSILLVNQIKSRHAPGATVAEVAPIAVKARFRAILLTSLTTVAGLTPLLAETSLQAQVLIPLVTSLAFGLMASTLLVLFVVPAFYAVLDDLGVTTLAAERRAAARLSPSRV